MNIPPKYEDVVAKLDAALGRDAALQQRLTVAEQLLAAAHTYVKQTAGTGIGAARRLTAQIETHFDGELAALKPAAEGEGS